MFLNSDNIRIRYISEIKKTRSYTCKAGGVNMRDIAPTVLRGLEAELGTLHRRIDDNIKWDM